MRAGIGIACSPLRSLEGSGIDCCLPDSPGYGFFQAVSALQDGIGHILALRDRFRKITEGRNKPPDLRSGIRIAGYVKFLMGCPS